MYFAKFADLARIHPEAFTRQRALVIEADFESRQVGNPAFWYPAFWLFAVHHQEPG